MVVKLFCQPGVRPFVFRDDEDPRRILVDAVYESGPHVAVLEQRQVFEVVGQRVDQRARIVAVTRVYDHSGGFVDDDQVVVLVADVERNVFGNDFDFANRVGHHDRNPVERFDFVTRFYWRAVDEDGSGVGSRLDAVARSAFHAVGKELVDAQQGLPLVDREAEMLVHLILLIVVRSR